MARDFETEWRSVRQQVQLYCYRAAGNRDDAEDVFQQVAVRAWRGYASFRGDCAFLSWAIAIARRETARVMGRKAERTRNESSLEHISEEAPAMLPSVPMPSVPAAGDNWLARAAREAVADNSLTECEANILIARIALPDSSWDQIGDLLSIDGGTCAVTHCRAIPKLRVFLFLRRADLLGGKEAIGVAFEAARTAKDDPLSPVEAEVFRRIVLENQTGYRKPGWMTSLRAACSKVIRRLTLP